MAGKRILLVEPGYRNKYPPLGLMKLATYHKNRRPRDEVQFVKLTPPNRRSGLGEKWDRVYVTTLFSFEWKRTSEAINYAIKAAGGDASKVFVGGIAASLMHDAFQEIEEWRGVRFIKGLLNGSPATALRLVPRRDFGGSDFDGLPIEEAVPDYSILNDIDYVYPVNDAYFGYASRGCMRKCKFCGVPKLEGDMMEMPPLAKLVDGVIDGHGEKKDLVLMDNNITASARYKEIIAEIRDLGFKAGAKISRGDRRPVMRRVDFNQGVDARILSKDPMFLREMATICISPLRIAFDHLGLRKVYEKSIRMAADNGLVSLSNYMLYNFHDTPGDLYNRMRLNIDLNQELGIRIWSFPMRFQPVDLKDRSHVGEKWNRYFLRSFQVMLQATRGVVSGNPEFFEHAYGETEEVFNRMLTLPHGFIFNRKHYQTGVGKDVREEYEMRRGELTSCEEQDLMSELIGPESVTKLPSREYYLRRAADPNLDSKIRELLKFHALDTRNMVDSKDDLQSTFLEFNADLNLPSDEERVEDAGLYDEDDHQANADA